MLLLSYGSCALMLTLHSSQKQKTPSPASYGGEDSLLPTHEANSNE